VIVHSKILFAQLVSPQRCHQPYQGDVKVKSKPVALDGFRSQ